MFTGLIKCLGSITQKQDAGDFIQLEIMSERSLTSDLGASIACNGVCLTATTVSERSFTVDISAETLDKTTARYWQLADHLNLEPSLKLGDELGGHFVFGHVDCVGQLLSIKQIDQCYKLQFSLPETIQKLVVQKGSIAINGISLTVNECSLTNFEVMIIPHTWQHTTLQYIKVGDQVNLEADMLARYVQRQLC